MYCVFVADATGQSSRQFNRGVSEAEKAIQGSMSAGDLSKEMHYTWYVYIMVEAVLMVVV